MRSWMRIGVVLSLALLAAGCFETKQVITLNPDGSGKVEIDALLAVSPMMAAAGGGKAPDANLIAQQSVRQMVTDSQGIDAWSGVSADVTKEGKVHIAGTAYFSDLAKVKVEGVPGMQAKWTKDGKDMVLEAVMESPEEGEKPEPAKANLSDEEVAKALKAKREEWAMQKMMAAQILGSLRMEVTFVLPGKAGEVNILEKTDKGHLRLVMEGKKMLEAMDKIMADDKIMKESIKAGKDPMKDGGSDAMMEAMYGKKGPIRAKTTGDLKPVFDYKAEMEKAKAAQPAMMKALGLDAPPVSKPDRTGTLPPQPAE